MISKILLAKENKERKHMGYLRGSVAYQHIQPAFEEDPIKRWMKQAEKDEETYWRRKFEEKI